MRHVQLSPRAVADLESIADYIAEDNPVRARSFVLELQARCRRLKDHPLQGRAVAILGFEGRVLSFKGYLILYRAMEAAVVVDRIVHGARDLAALFDDRGD